MLEDKGNTAVYLLYAYTRIKSIGRGAQLDEDAILRACQQKTISLDHEKEWKLAKVSVRSEGWRNCGSTPFPPQKRKIKKSWFILVHCTVDCGYNCAVMPAVHSHRVHLTRVARDETGRVQLSTLLSRALNFGAQHEATARRDTRPFDSCIMDLGETRAPKLHERIQGKASVSIYILALALSRVPSARVYSPHNSIIVFQT